MGRTYLRTEFCQKPLQEMVRDQVRIQYSLMKMNPGEADYINTELCPQQNRDVWLSFNPG